jgi:DNA-binding HxlR family transcriptional regulator
MSGIRRAWYLCYKKSSERYLFKSEHVRYCAGVAKTYDQYCPVAVTLDLVGERWTLLIIRELLGGPLRYTDLQAALKGIPPNLLADRLRDLEANGLVEKQVLPPPAARSVFALTDDGRALDRVVRDLARWGLRRLEPPDPGDHVRGDSAARAGLLSFASLRGHRTLRRTWLVTTGDPADDVTIRARDGRLSWTRGAPEEPDLVVHIQPAALLRWRMVTTRRPRRLPVTFDPDAPADLVDEFLSIFELTEP